MTRYAGRLNRIRGALAFAWMVLRAPWYVTPVLCMMPDEDSATELRMYAQQLIRRAVSRAE